MAKILILGSNGMLGSTLLKFFNQHTHHQCTHTTRKPHSDDPNHIQFDAIQYCSGQDNLALNTYDFVINCIGIINKHINESDPSSINNALTVNMLFPHKLAQELQSTKTKVIQIATDCVFDGKTGNYHESSPHNPLDAYAKTKSLGEVIYSPQCINLRCSIIGHEQSQKKYNLLDWFLSHPDNSTVPGYSNHYWNGVTTLQFAQLVNQIIDNDMFSALRTTHHTHHVVLNQSVSKQALLELINNIYKRKIQLDPIEIDPGINRTLTTKYSIVNQCINPTNLEKALNELRLFNLQRNE